MSKTSLLRLQRRTEHRNELREWKTEKKKKPQLIIFNNRVNGIRYFFSSLLLSICLLRCHTWSFSAHTNWMVARARSHMLFGTGICTYFLSGIWYYRRNRRGRKKAVSRFVLFACVPRCEHENIIRAMQELCQRRAIVSVGPCTLILAMQTIERIFAV